jgi:hypothetical protein
MAGSNDAYPYSRFALIGQQRHDLLIAMTRTFPMTWSAGVPPISWNNNGKC